MKAVLTLLIIFNSFIVYGSEIENPFEHYGELLKVNGYSVLTYKKYNSSQSLLSSGTVRGTLMSQEDFYGEEIKVLKINTTVTPIGGTPEANEMYEVYIDDDFAFNNTVSSLKYASSILNRSVGKPPSTKTIKVGDKWKNIGYRTGFTEVTTQQGDILTLPIRIVLESESTFLGLESIDTIWGRKNAAVIQTQKVFESGNQEWSDGAYKYRNTFEVTRQTIKEYFLKEMGAYKIETITQPAGYTFTQTYTPTGSSQSYPYPSALETEILTYEYSSRNLSPTNFSEVTVSSNSGASVTIDSWTWNGAFPWIYNHGTASWFYYHFTGTGYMTYDARSGNWLNFNGATNSWVASD